MVTDVAVVQGSSSVFKRRWFEADECWSSEQLASQFSAVLGVRDAFNAVVSSDKPGDFDAVIRASSPLLQLLQVTAQLFSLQTCFVREVFSRI